MDAKRPSLGHIIIKLPKVKDKERILKAVREKQIRSFHKTVSQFLKRNFAGYKDWQQIFEVMKSRDLQPRLFYPAKISFRIKGQIKSFPDKRKLKEFIISKLLYEM